MATGADAAVLRAGALAADRDFPAGPLTVADMMELVDPVARETVCVVEVTGDKLLLALESCLSNAPEPDPSFPLLSNLSLAFDPARPALRRVDAAATLVAGGPLDRARTYAVAVSGLGPGAENYAGSRVAPGAASAWAGCPLRRQAKDLPPLGALLRRRLEALAREGGGQGLVLAPEGRILDRSGV
uniref:5'-Nucleotidase C-terminal domain-containing protein n=1 Tax=Heterosigma akashiwo TaxID=2829 RepID=A0A7S3Y664_HETAK